MDPSFLYFKDSANTIQQDKNYYDSNFLDLLKTTALAVAKLNSTLAAKQKEIQKYNANLDSDSPTLPQHLDQNGLSKNLQFLDESERKVYIKNRLKNYVDTKLKITLAETQTKIDTVYNQFTIDFTSLKETLKDYLPTSAMPTPEHAKLLLDNKALNIFVQFNLTAKKHELIAENKRRLAEAAKKKKEDEMDVDSGPTPTATQFQMLLNEVKQLKNQIKSNKVPKVKPKNLNKGHHPPETEKDGKKAQQAINKKRKAPKSFTRPNAHKKAKGNQNTKRK